MVSRETPLGFASRVPRFLEQKKRIKLGPGSYSPEYRAVEPKVKGEVFSKSKRACLTSDSERVQHDKFPNHILALDRIISTTTSSRGENQQTAIALL